MNTWVFLHKYRIKYWKQFWLAAAFVTIETTCDLLQPTIVSKIIDIGVADRRPDYILSQGALMVLITALGALAASIRNVIASKVSQNFGSELRGDLYEKIQMLSFTNIDNLNRTSLVTRLTNDVNQVQLLVNSLMRISLKAPLLCIGSLIMAINLNPHLAVILIFIVPIILLLIVITIKVGFPRFAQVQTALDQVNAVMREYLSGIRVVKAFKQFEYEQEKFAAANQELQGKSVGAIRLMSVFSPSIALTVNLGIVMVLWLGGLGVNTGQIQVGHIIAFINYMSQILVSLMIVFLIFNNFVRAKASVIRIGEVFKQHNDAKWIINHFAFQPVNKGRIDFENVSFSYAGLGGPTVLRDINLTCLPGQTVGIIGATGAGKTSLVNLIPRFYEVTAGFVKVDGHDITEINPGQLRDKIALVPQQAVLFTGTIMDNIRWGKENATAQEVAAAAKLAAAHDFIISFPEGYNTKLGQGGVNLSGGQKQRLAIARALIRKPAILILDDCTSAIDIVTEEKIKQALNEYASQLTCLVVAQRISTVLDADKIAVMEGGTITACGTHTELLQTSNVYCEIVQSQRGRR
ncbi:Putative multidrug export ATP-binding/permease protein [Sporomusa ovata DSM 2662]|uniref:Lipid A export ATP-binding/permease protein MsbA n=1 Tax=Sporomusa ovata TaxID=2378 RepID=A0A0U1L5E5_9FIRM|nr:ABC transporter ATP-binding protein [Sporomusa ovata]EQB28576.1 ABC-type multidrug transport system, ATPase and permease component [Sporomusa ovata DSM 2662]CQR74907.1 Lipid A export ATP-binding/permease protein MsbA [Sporomusa ovata]